MVFTPETDIAAFGGDPTTSNSRAGRSISRSCGRTSAASRKDTGLPKNRFLGTSPGRTRVRVGTPGQHIETRNVGSAGIRARCLAADHAAAHLELRGGYIQYGRSNQSDMELVEAPLNNLENGIKVRRKLLDALHDDALITRKKTGRRTLRTLREPVRARPWQQIEAASMRERAMYLPYTFIEGSAGFNTILFRYARLLVRGADERKKPNTERLREFTDSMLPRIEQQLSARVPIYAEVETLTLSFSLQRMREWLGPDYPLVRNLLVKESPEKFGDPRSGGIEARRSRGPHAVWRGGKAAVDESRDPMIELARSVDGESRRCADDSTMRSKRQ